MNEREKNAAIVAAVRAGDTDTARRLADLPADKGICEGIAIFDTIKELIEMFKECREIFDDCPNNENSDFAAAFRAFLDTLRKRREDRKTGPHIDK